MKETRAWKFSTWAEGALGLSLPVWVDTSFGNWSTNLNFVLRKLNSQLPLEKVTFRRPCYRARRFQWRYAFTRSENSPKVFAIKCIIRPYFFEKLLCQSPHAKTLRLIFEKRNLNFKGSPFSQFWEKLASESEEHRKTGPVAMPGDPDAWESIFDR